LLKIRLASTAWPKNRCISMMGWNSLHLAALNRCFGMAWAQVH
jgi:hypothetical protein